MAVKARANKFEGMMRIGEAAEFMGVTSESLRNWDRSGRLVPKRNPVTGYRYYTQNDLEKFLAKRLEERGYE